MTDPTAALKVEGLCKSFGALEANKDVSFEVRADEVHALIGPNGAGKTTAISLFAGEQKADAGRISLFGEDVTHTTIAQRARLGIARSNQITSVLPQFSALENVVLALWARQGHGFRFFRPARADRATLQIARQRLQDGGLGDAADVPAGELSHGQRRLLELAMALAQAPRLLLLDEPMAGMGQEGAERIISLLLPLKGKIPILLVEHDMDAVFALADRITVLVEGTPIRTGTPDEIRKDKAVQAAYLGDDPEARDAEA